MNVLKTQVYKQHDVLVRYVCSILRTRKLLPNVSFYTTTVDTFDVFATDLVQREKITSKHFVVLDKITQYYEKPDVKSIIISADAEELDNTLRQLLLKKKDKQIEDIIKHCLTFRKHINDNTLKILLKHYSNAGNIVMVTLLQKYSAKLVPNVYRRNGEFNHYLAKVQYYKGNSEKSLSILRDSYKNNENLRGFYRVIFRDLINDSVMNRSEASLVVFKKYVLEFSTVWDEHYPLVCFWHICWLSTWYSDQMLSNELWDTSESLRNIVSNKVTALSISALKNYFNEDAVVRLLQTLLKYQMMGDYSKVLQVLFGYKLRNRDIRGCTEILRNCEVLGITLPSDQQGMYIKMLIFGNTNSKPQTKTPSKDFKLKF